MFHFLFLIEKLSPIFVGLFAALVLASCNSNSPSRAQNGEVTVVTVEDLSFQPLNPARGDASPQAGVLWGDIREDTASGMILKFADGFSSPPHIHNITYRGVVIKGGLHNDDPDAAKMWMGPGSYWTQPAGEDHITAAKPGSGAISFLEIFKGPYLVKPSSDAFQTQELPVNIDASNLVWLGPQDLEWIEDNAKGARVTLLWGEPKDGNLFASFVKLPSGFKGAISTAEDAKMVLITGEILYRDGRLKPGSYIHATGPVEHNIECVNMDCQIYVRANTKYAIKQ